MVGYDDGGLIRKGGLLVDVDRLEAVLIAAARERRTLTYAEVLRFFGQRVTPRRVFGLSRDLTEVARRNAARGEPRLPVLVVRQADRLPGEGFFAGARRRGAYAGPSTGPEAAAYVRARTEEVFRYWAKRPAPDSAASDAPATGRRREGLTPPLPPAAGPSELAG